MHKFKGTIILKELSNLSNIFETYDTFVIDLWGVIHNGLALNPKAIEAIDQLKNNKGVLFWSVSDSIGALGLHGQVWTGPNSDIMSCLFHSGSGSEFVG